MNLLIHSMIPSSEVNGPGSRFVIWTQGCSKGCRGCFNPETWKSSGGMFWNPVELAELVLASGAEGLTLTGGDPLEQPDSLLEFLRALHDGEILKGLPKGIICFTGFVIEELPDAAQECLRYIDLLIDGRYVEELRFENGLAGSSNQRFHFSNLPGRGVHLIGEDVVVTDQAIEVHSSAGDEVEVTGFPAINRQLLKKLGLKIIK